MSESPSVAEAVNAMDQMALVFDRFNDLRKVINYAANLDQTVRELNVEIDAQKASLAEVQGQKEAVLADLASAQAQAKSLKETSTLAANAIVDAANAKSNEILVAANDASTNAAVQVSASAALLEDLTNQVSAQQSALDVLNAKIDQAKAALRKMFEA